MKKIVWRKSFKKDYRKISEKKKRALLAAFVLIEENPRGVRLRRHKLLGKYEGLESIDVTSDLRALFLETKEGFVFYYLKNHNQLYN